MKKEWKLNKKYAFTLAEVLITLAIIGIVAAMTLPTLMNRIQDQQYKTAYKKAYSAMSQAFQRAVSDQNIVPLTGPGSALGFETNFSAIKSYFSIAQECDASNLSVCWASGDTWRNESSNVPSFIDKSGMAWRLRAPEASLVSPVILVDINGNKAPNKYGQDRFPILFASATATAWGVDNIGMPIKMVPLADILTNDETNTCAFAATHPCYFTSWLYN